MHDFPEFVQIGLRDEIVRFEPQRTQVVGFSLCKLSIEMEDGSEVHQSSSVLRETKRNTERLYVLRLSYSVPKNILNGMLHLLNKILNINIYYLRKVVK